MIKGTSQTFKFKIPCQCDDVTSSRVIFWQENYNGPATGTSLPIVKDSVHTSFEGNEIFVTLLPSETSSFASDRKGYVQMVLMDESGEVFGTKKTMFTVYDNKATIDIPTTPTSEGFIILDGKSIAE